MHVHEAQPSWAETGLPVPTCRVVWPAGDAWLAVDSAACMPSVGGVNMGQPTLMKALAQIEKTPCFLAKNVQNCHVDTLVKLALSVKEAVVVNSALKPAVGSATAEAAQQAMANGE